MSNLINLIDFSLRGCKLSDSEPDLEKCTKLEVLDLSETDIQSLPSLDKFGNLCDLNLRCCSRLEKLLSLKSLIHLEVLDVWGTGVKEFPYEISEQSVSPCPDLLSFYKNNQVSSRLQTDLFGISKNSRISPRT
jgi:Leucine-rich repeat (LRR) protein